MSLSKQLYIIMAFIFFMIFTGNFIISVKNTKEYLEVESITKAQDTATSLGMALKPLLKDRNNPEIKSIVRAIANSGFYKEIRLEDINFTIDSYELLSLKNLNPNDWKIQNISVDKKYGKLEIVTSDEELSKELEELEDEQVTYTDEEFADVVYDFLPTPNYKNGGKIEVSYTAISKDNQKVNAMVSITLDKIIAQVKRKEKFEYVPSWFINLIPINLEEKSSEISSGWKQSAVIYISANAGEAYAKLYEQVKGAMIYATIAFLLSMAILFVFVQYLLKPLKKIEKLANNIAKGKFGIIKPLPWTTEIKSVALAMNDMSSKIEAIINKLNKNLENMTAKLSKDKLTGLDLKQNFETDMKHMFIHKKNGYIFIIKIFDLVSFAQSHTTKEINDFIKAFAKIIKDTKVSGNLKTQAYRFYGSEFALIGENFTYEDATKYSLEVQKKLEDLYEEFEKADIAHIGATPFNPIGTTPEMLHSANEAYEKATLIGPNEAYIRNSNDLSRDMEAWRDLIFDIIDNRKFDVQYIGNAISLDGKDTLLMQEAFTSAKDKNNNDIPIGSFVSIAEKYQKIVQFDKNVIESVIDYILINNISHKISINLSLESIYDTSFISWLEKNLKKNKNIAGQLVFSITAYAAAKDVDKFKFFVDEMHEWGAKVIIKRFETRFIPLDNIKDFNLDYIRLARSYTSEIANDTSKQSFVESISDLSNLLNIKVFAEDVKDDADLETLEKYNIYGASR